MSEQKKTPITKTAPKKLEAQVYDIAGKVTGSVELDKELFGAKPNDILIAQYVRVYLANQRQGNASVKTRAEIIGTTHKKYKQKGTGRARHGSGKSNIFRGGGVTFGPQTRDHSLSMNKKQKASALRIALSLRAKEKNISVIKTKGIGAKPQTKTVAAALINMDIDNKKTLFVADELKRNIFTLSSRNIPRVALIQSKTLNAYTVLNHDAIMFVDDALDTIVTHFGAKK